jgi:hypothetical protein
MLGQGSPYSTWRLNSIGLSKAYRVALRFCCALVVFTVVSKSFLSLAQARPSPQDQSTETIRLRIYWGGGKPQQWQGSIQVSQGQFTNLQPLGVSVDAAASVIGLDQRLQINHWSPTSYGGVDVDVPYLAGNGLRLNLRDRNHPEASFDDQVPLQDLLHQPYSESLDAEGNRIVITRAPGDQLPLGIEREHLIFEPQERFEFALRVKHTDWVSQRVNCKIRIQPSVSLPSERSRTWGAALTANFQDHEQTKTVSFDLDASGSAPEQRIDWLLPKEEGVYTFSMELTTPWQQASLKPRTTVRRQLQVVVIASQPPTASDEKAWRSILTIDPVRGGAPAANPLFSIGRKNESHPPLGNDLGRSVMIESQTMLELGVGGWQAIPLLFDQLGQPHLIEIEYLADQPMNVGFSLLEMNVNGQIPAYGIDSGLHIPPSLIEIYPRSEPRLRKRHQLVCWPQERLSYLLIANRDSQNSAIIGNIELWVGPKRLPVEQETPALGEPSSTTSLKVNFSGEQNASSSEWNAPRRTFMAFSESGIFEKNFGAREAMDPVGGSFDDWQTYYQGADRLVQYLKSHGYSGAYVTVASDGSTLYPSRILGSTPRLDTGVLFSTGQDPMRKDVLELLFRLCEREGLTLVPALVLNGALPRVEVLRSEVEGTDRVAGLVHWNGTPAETQKPHFPIYNPLHPLVQDQGVAAVEELSARYARFRSFGGIAVICRPDSYSILAGQQWGYDDETLNEFWRTAGRTSELPEDRQQRREYLFGSQMNQWLQWRAQSLASWYGRMAREIRNHHATANLFLAPVDLYRNEEMEASLAPGLHSPVDYRKQMLRLGWDPPTLAQLEGVKILKSKRLAPNQSLARNRHEISLDNQRHADEFFRDCGAIGELFVHRIPWAHFSQLQEQVPFQGQQSALMRLQPLAPAGAWSQQRFLNSLRAGDMLCLVDGGQMMPTGQERELREMISVFRQLPAVPFREVSLADSAFKLRSTELPVIVRQFLGAGQLWFYVVNASPWPCKVRLRFSSDASDPLAISMFHDISIQQTLEGTQRIIELELRPLSMTGGMVQSPLPIENYQFELPPQAADKLRKQVHVLQAKLVRSINSQALDVLSNGDFENNGQPLLSGWEFNQQGTRGISLNNQDAFQGESSLRMNNEGSTPVWIRSNSFPLPETGRLSISVWLKTPNSALQPPLRISIEGTTSDAGYYRFGSLGGLAPDPQFNQLTDQWQRFALHFDDLPMDRLTNVRVGLDLMGAGVVDVDRFEIYDRWFDERDAKAINQRLASSSPLLSNPITYESSRILLGSYWLRFLDEMNRDSPASPIEGDQERVRLSDKKLSSQDSQTDLVSEKDPSKIESESNNEANERGLFRRLRRSGNRIPR